MATTAEKFPKPPEGSSAPDVVKFLADDVKTVEELKAVVGDQGISAAWGAGLIEFGRRKHIICGNIERWDGYYLLESGVEWSGAKTRVHKTWREITADEEKLFPQSVADGDSTREVVYRDATLPRVKSNILPVGFAPGQSLTYTVAAPISRDKAMADLKLKVRLTDKGLERLQG